MILGKKKQDERTREQEQRDRIIKYKRVFGSTEGKEVLYDILNRCFILNTHKGDAFSEGKRAVALDILNNCNINLADFDQLLKGTDS